VNDERIIQLLEEIRDLGRRSAESYEKALRNQEEALRTQAEAVRNQQRFLSKQRIAGIAVLILMAAVIVGLLYVERHFGTSGR
jgi:hypothetical protein